MRNRNDFTRRLDIEWPVIQALMAGGIADGRGLAAARALGASAVQVGTAFLGCSENGASPAYRAAVTAPDDGDRTALTRAFSGRLARGVRNRFVEGMAGRPVLPFPFQNALTQDMRGAATMVREARAILDGLRSPSDSSSGP